MATASAQGAEGDPVQKRPLVRMRSAEGWVAKKWSERSLEMKGMMSSCLLLLRVKTTAMYSAPLGRWMKAASWRVEEVQPALE